MRNALIYNIIGDRKGKLTWNDVVIITKQNKILYDFLNNYIYGFLSYCNYHLLYSEEIKEKKEE
jgi:hypothetical protein